MGFLLAGDWAHMGMHMTIPLPRAAFAGFHNFHPIISEPSSRSLCVPIPYCSDCPIFFMIVWAGFEFPFISAVLLLYWPPLQISAVCNSQLVDCRRLARSMFSRGRCRLPQNNPSPAAEFPSLGSPAPLSLDVEAKTSKLRFPSRVSKLWFL